MKGLRPTLTSRFLSAFRQTREQCPQTALLSKDMKDSMVFVSMSLCAQKELGYGMILPSPKTPAHRGNHTIFDLFNVRFGISSLQIVLAHLLFWFLMPTP